MVQDTLQEQVPSRDSKFVKDVLFKAIERADRQKVSELLKEDPMLVNAQDETGRTPMEVLTSFYNPNWFKDPVTKRIAIYELLKAKGAMPDLVAAIVASDVAQVRKLVKADPNLVHQWIPSQRMPASECGRHGFFKGDIHPLTFAVKFGHIQVMEILLEAGADVNADSDQALHEAAWSWPVPNRQNIREVIDWLVAHGAKVNPYYKEPSPLMIAARYHRSETVKALLENGADANACVESVGGPPLAVAISAEPLSGSRDERHKSIEWLIKAGATYNDDRNPDDAITAIYRGRVDLLEKHLSVNPQLIHERLELTPNSADALFVDDVPYTWEYFGRVYYTHCPINGGTLLHLAAEYDEDAIAAFLLGRGADINARAKQDANGVGGHTPIFNAAASYYCSRVFELLVERGADLTIKATFLIGDGEKLELTPLSYTKLVIERSGYTDESMKQKAIDLLRKHGASE